MYKILRELYQLIISSVMIGVLITSTFTGYVIAAKMENQNEISGLIIGFITGIFINVIFGGLALHVININNNLEELKNDIFDLKELIKKIKTEEKSSEYSEFTEKIVKKEENSIYDRNGTCRKTPALGEEVDFI